MAKDTTQYPTGRYVLNQKAHMARTPGGDVEMLEGGTEIVYDGKPGPHMDALDDDARLAKAMAGQQDLHPENKIALTMGSAEDRRTEAMVAAVTKGITEGLAAAMPAMGAAIGAALVAAMTKGATVEDASKQAAAAATAAAPPLPPGVPTPLPPPPTTTAAKPPKPAKGE